jgi:hypothetical protein
LGSGADICGKTIFLTLPCAEDNQYKRDRQMLEALEIAGILVGDSPPAVAAANLTESISGCKFSQVSVDVTD